MCKVFNFLFKIFFSFVVPHRVPLEGDTDRSVHTHDRHGGSGEPYGIVRGEYLFIFLLHHGDQIDIYHAYCLSLKKE